ncbi:hypothetical protein PBY51_021955 [Eleginops maclovinus]|uniref:L27 domain-containing protein n=1 Tax=Eleginops maclovinus TaxID=56733 RepID=A0AAN7XGV8_ELEMC|nr:hypothetical protein PBY51_021955 [Eleginops maclovinus]
MPVRKKDAQRALLLLEDYRAKLHNAEDRQLRGSIQRVIDIFQSNLFQALIDIQEFYEVTLLDSQRWGESSKPADPMAPVQLWDFSSLQSPTATSDTLPSLSTSIEDSPLLNEILHTLAQNKRPPWPGRTCKYRTPTGGGGGGCRMSHPVHVDHRWGVGGFGGHRFNVSLHSL